MMFSRPKDEWSTFDHDENSFDLHEAAMRNNLRRVKALIEANKGENKDDWQHPGCWGAGHTPLFEAAHAGSIEVVKYLVEIAQCTIDKVNDDSIGQPGCTALHGAAMNGHTEIVRYLLEQGADKDKRNGSGWPPLHIAVQARNVDVVKVLMVHGADLDLQLTGVPLTAIQFARHTGDNDDIIQAIIDEPIRRRDDAPSNKRSVEQEENSDEEEQINKQSRINLAEGTDIAAVEEETKVASADEDSEPSSDEEED